MSGAIFYHNFKWVKLSNNFSNLALDDFCYQMYINIHNDRVVHIYVKYVNGVHKLQWNPSDLGEDVGDIGGDVGERGHQM